MRRLRDAEITGETIGIPNRVKESIVYLQRSRKILCESASAS